MPRITKENYETFALDYIEGRLADELHQEMLAFLKTYPELSEDIEACKNLHVNPDFDEDYPFKQLLKMDERFDLQEVGDEDLKSLERYRLPKETFVYPYKSELKKVLMPDRKPYLWLQRAAAVVGIALGLSSLYLLLIPNNNELSDQALASVHALHPDSNNTPNEAPSLSPNAIDSSTFVNPTPPSPKQTPSPKQIPATENPTPPSKPQKTITLIAQSTLPPNNNDSTPQNITPSIHVQSIEHKSPKTIALNAIPVPRSIEYVDALYITLNETDEKTPAFWNFEDRFIDALGKISRGIARNYYRRKYEFQQMMTPPIKTYEVASKK